MNEKAVAQLIRARAIARREREFAQRQLLPEDDDFKATVEAKLRGLCDTPQFRNFERCGNEEIFRTCKHCGQVEKFKYRCNIKWCPRCQWRVVQMRQKLIGLWASKILQPKHLVLTQKNFPILTRRKIRRHSAALRLMRRRDSLKKMRGGCTSVEITNEGNGWHLHSHWLIDCDWLVMPEVAKDWAQIVGQEFAVCKVMDCRGKEYVQEVSKYVCEGSELAKWPAEKLNEFVRAIRGLRFFFAFGSLFALGPAIRAELEAQSKPPPECDCGESAFVYRSETDEVLHEIQVATRARRR